MSDTQATEVIDTGAVVAVPEGEVSREDLVKLIEDARAADPDAPEGEEPEAVEAKPVEAAKELQSAKIIERITANRRAEARAAAEREAIRTERAEVERLRGEAAEMAKQAEALKAAKLSPSKALELLGMSPKEFLESLATEHEPAAIAKRETAGTLSEVEKLKAEVAAMKAAAEAREHAARKQQGDALYNEATQAFIQHVDGAAEKYPHLIAEMTPAELAAAARAAAEQHAKPYFAKYGEYPDDDVIAEYLEGQAKARAEALAERRARVGITATPPRQGTPAIQGQPATATKPRTLTNGQSSVKATAPKEWSQKAADEESKRILQQMYAQASDD